MKTLLLVRHAKSSWKYTELDDFERPLNNRGHRDAPRMGKILSNMKIKPDMIISSPANRAATTARLIAEQVGFPLENIQYEESIYESGVSNLFSVVKNIDTKFEKVLMVGHNPGFTEMANALTGNTLSNLPTAGIISTELDIDSWSQITEGCGKVIFFEYPKKYTAGG